MTWYQPPNVYGIFFVIINTLYVVFLATLLAAPISVLTALFIGRMTNRTVGGVLQTGIELLAAIPSVVFGVFGLGMVNAFVMWLAETFGRQTAGGISTLSSVFVLGMMIMPTITMMSLSAINAVDREVENNSLALGASKIQTYFRITLRASASGIISGIVLGVGRALGEATAVSMVAGNAGSGPTFDLFDTTRTMTSTMLLGLKETTGLDYDIRFSVGVMLIVMILVSNMVLSYVKKKAGTYS
jgi:phosphate transport system permease protein